ncbi:hypothetical protein EJB05_30936 [Eragrostis curvula]|uniref:Uncharacterized protein n=1 Tax=Eragrostis curvula TaxID=38414 RepID=A0A5J9UDV3_9POAL|nr:hypothetical protein EJB05_30936 [Eragrostis curvula]
MRSKIIQLKNYVGVLPETSTPKHTVNNISAYAINVPSNVVMLTPTETPELNKHCKHEKASDKFHSPRSVADVPGEAPVPLTGYCPIEMKGWWSSM